jgi:deoxyribose-phosphate aldolase
MQGRKTQTLAAVAALILLTSVAVNAAEVAICSVVGNPAGFDHQNVTLQGAATAVKEYY